MADGVGLDGACNFVDEWMDGRTDGRTILFLLIFLSPTAQMKRGRMQPTIGSFEKSSYQGSNLRRTCLLGPLQKHTDFAKKPGSGAYDTKSKFCKGILT